MINTRYKNIRTDLENFEKWMNWKVKKKNLKKK